MLATVSDATAYERAPARRYAVLTFDRDPATDSGVVAALSGRRSPIGLLVRSLVDRFLEEGDPLRYYVSQSILYGDTFLHFLVGLATTPLKRGGTGAERDRAISRSPSNPGYHRREVNESILSGRGRRKVS